MSGNKIKAVSPKMGRPKKDNPATAIVPNIRVTIDRLEAYKSAAKGADKSLSQWVRDCLDDKVNAEQD